jgi:hypothetical protein
MSERAVAAARPNASELWWRVWLAGLAVALLVVVVRAMHLGRGAYPGDLRSRRRACTRQAPLERRAPLRAMP